LHSIKISNLNYKADGFSLHRADLTIEFKSVLVFSGDSGSGKSTLLRVLLGLESGGPNFSWKFNEKVMSNLSMKERRIGMVFQDYALFPHLTCRENIAYPEGSEEGQVIEIISQLQLESCQNRKASLLSGGEKQRTALGRALSYKPNLLFLDEPFSALDTRSKFAARERIYNDLKKFNVPTILVTHDPQDYKAQDVTLMKFSEGTIFAVEDIS